MPMDSHHIEYLTTHSHGRLATIAPNGTPQNKPVGYRYNPALGTIDIAGFDMERSAKYRNAGQVCVSVQRIYVHADLERAFLDRFATSVAALKVGDPILRETEVGPLIRPRETDRVLAWIEEAVVAGARLIGGGRTNATTVVPSIIVNPPSDAKVSTLEVFGPVTCVYPFTRLDEALAAANSLPMAFQASIFTEDLRTAFDAAERLAASAVMINDHTAFRADWMPFAGRRQSGYGIGGIPWTMQEMSEQKMIVFRM